MDNKLRAAAIKKVESELAKSKPYHDRGNRYWTSQYAKFTFKNTREVQVTKASPVKGSGAKGSVHYEVKFMGKTILTHGTLDEMIEKLFELGNANKTLFEDGTEISTKALIDGGWQQVERLQEPNIKDIGYGFSEGLYNWKLELDTCHTYYGREYSPNSCNGYYGSTYEDAFYREYLYIQDKDGGDWYKVLYREVQYGTRCVSNYVGD